MTRLDPFADHTLTDLFSAYRGWVVGEFGKYRCRDVPEFRITAGVLNLWTKTAEIANGAACGRAYDLSAVLRPEAFERARLGVAAGA
jgi:hypothetical protein